jgi:hypothetical protein
MGILPMDHGLEGHATSCRSPSHLSAGIVGKDQITVGGVMLFPLKV